jgi:hypothetical protein
MANRVGESDLQRIRMRPSAEGTLSRLACARARGGRDRRGTVDGHIVRDLDLAQPRKLRRARSPSRIRPSLLLMLWTAPPPARECH